MWKGRTAHLLLQYLQHGSDDQRLQIIEKARVQIPKEFFRTVAITCRHKQPTFFVNQFRHSIESDKIIPAISISEYMRDLYKSPTYYIDPNRRADI